MNPMWSITVFVSIFSFAASDSSSLSSSLLIQGVPMEAYQGFMDNDGLPPVGVGDGVIIKGVPEISFCNESLTPLVVNSFSFQPENIKSNENVTLSIYATLKEEVSSGKIRVQAKVGFLPVPTENLDLCTELKAGGMKCPLAPMDYKIQQVLPIPWIPVHGSVSAQIKMMDQKDADLLCMDVKVHI